MTKRTVCGMIVVALTLALLAGCNRAPQPPLVFGATAWPGYESVYLARELGYFSKANLQLVDYSGVSELKQALRGGKVTLAALTLDEALLLRRDVPDLKIILLFDAAPAPAASQSGKRIDVLVTRDQTIGLYHGDLQKFVQGWRHAIEYVHSDRAKALQIMAQHEHLTPEQFDKALQPIELYDLRRNLQLMVGEPPAIGNDIVAMQRSLLNKGLLNIGEDPSLVVDATLLAEAVK